MSEATVFSTSSDDIRLEAGANEQALLVSEHYREDLFTAETVVFV